ncbi:FAD-dependent oxidoreductase [Streptomyces sp. NPDC097981]|uniref:flavin monoamine oxidase family protein n=1 Tax=Streptomyces sp. NPDC097981 TaxID=3155428 RepID=UPI003324E7D9
MTRSGWGGELGGVAVIGAGVGGCYTACRLTAGARQVTLYESGYRVGGRIWSVPVRGGGWAELGAMRLNTEAAPVMALLKHLGLAGSLVPFSFGRPENLVRARGRVVRQRNASQGLGAAYRLTGREWGADADGLVLATVEAAVPGFSALREKYHGAVQEGRAGDADQALVDYRAAREASVVRGKPLRELSWPGVLAAGLSPEALRLVTDTSGYDVHPGGAAEWIDVVFHTPPRAEYVTLSCGIQALPTALHGEFRKAGGRTCWGRRLTRIDRAAGGYELTFAIDDQEGHDTGRCLRVQAETVVLALPQGALRRIDAGPAVFGPRWRHDLDTVEAVRATKLFLAYDQPWWRACGLSSGRSTTDLPLRQLWYEPGGAPRLLLAAYPSGPSAAVWDHLRTGATYREPASRAMFAGPPAPAAAVDYAHRLLCRMHRVRARPPVAACWQDWGVHPRAEAWHLWRPGQDSQQVAARMRAPGPGVGLHVVSDCWTGDPGSIPATLGCAEQVLREHLEADLPPWIP